MSTSVTSPSPLKSGLSQVGQQCPAMHREERIHVGVRRDIPVVIEVCRGTQWGDTESLAVISAQAPVLVDVQPVDGGVGITGADHRQDREYGTRQYVPGLIVDVGPGVRPDQGLPLEAARAGIRHDCRDGTGLAPRAMAARGRWLDNFGRPARSACRIRPMGQCARMSSAVSDMSSSRTGT